MCGVRRKRDSDCFFFFKQKTAYEITVWLEFRRVLFRSPQNYECEETEDKWMCWEPWESNNKQCISSLTSMDTGWIALDFTQLPFHYDHSHLLNFVKQKHSHCLSTWGLHGVVFKINYQSIMKKNHRKLALFIWLVLYENDTFKIFPNVSVATFINKFVYLLSALLTRKLKIKQLDFFH